MSGEPSLRARKLRTLLQRELGYETVRQKGSHRTLHNSHGYPPLTWAWDDGDMMG